MIVIHEKEEYTNVKQITFNHDPYEPTESLGINLYDDNGDLIEYFSLYPSEFPSLSITSEVHHD